PRSLECGTGLRRARGLARPRAGAVGGTGRVEDPSLTDSNRFPRGEGSRKLPLTEPAWRRVEPRRDPYPFTSARAELSGVEVGTSQAGGQLQPLLGSSQQGRP